MSGIVIVCGATCAKTGGWPGTGAILPYSRGRGISRHRLRLAISKFVPAFKASGSLLPFGNARVQACKQSSRRFAYGFQSQISFRDASASELHSSKGSGACPTQGGSHPTRNRVSV